MSSLSGAHQGLARPFSTHGSVAEEVRDPDPIGQTHWIRFLPDRVDGQELAS
jgi:hypothetical protein